MVSSLLTATQARVGAAYPIQFCERKPTSSIVDLLSRASPAIDVRHTYHGKDVVETLERAAQEYGYPKTIRVDNGPEFVSKELDLWAYIKDVALDFSRPGKPTDTDVVDKTFIRLAAP